jgi:hypothetical protein
VGRAYASYYIHANKPSTTLVQALKVQLKHDYLSKLLKGNIEPRLHLPNSRSALLRHFGVNWLGLEAPRHLSIPAEHSLRQQLVTLGFTLRSIADSYLYTASESFQIARRGTEVTRADLENVKTLRQNLAVDSNSNDFIKLVCHLPLCVDSRKSTACP